MVNQNVYAENDRLPLGVELAVDWMEPGDVVNFNGKIIVGLSVRPTWQPDTVTVFTPSSTDFL